MNQPEFETYWQKRTALRSTKYWQDADNVSKAIKKAYIANYNQLQKEMASIYAKYMKTGKGTYRATYVKQVMTNIDPKLTELFFKQNKEMKVLFGNTYQDEFYNSIFDLGKGGMEFAFTPLNSNALAKILAYPWSGAGFSDRLWDNKDKLYINLKQTMTQGLVQGQPYDKMIRNLANKMDVSYRQAGVLVKTETAHFMNQAHLDSYNEADIEEYRFLAAMEERTCPECEMLDGQVFFLKEAAVGENYPPIHPLCRCSTCPEMGQSHKGTRAAKVGDEWVEVPEDMTFDEWREANELAYLNPLSI